MFVVTVRFEIIEQHAESFRLAILENARMSLQHVAGCHRFDVCFSEDGRRCFLYELYTDRAAFDHHTTTRHFNRFNSVNTDMVASKQLETFVLSQNTEDRI